MNGAFIQRLCHAFAFAFDNVEINAGVILKFAVMVKLGVVVIDNHPQVGGGVCFLHGENQILNVGWSPASGDNDGHLVHLISPAIAK